MLSNCEPGNSVFYNKFKTNSKELSIETTADVCSLFLALYLPKSILRLIGSSSCIQKRIRSSTISVALKHMGKARDMGCMHQPEHTTGSSGVPSLLLSNCQRQLK